MFGSALCTVSIRPTQTCILQHNVKALTHPPIQPAYIYPALARSHPEKKLTNIIFKQIRQRIYASCVYSNSIKLKTYGPIVEMKVVLKASSENRNRRQDFPTPESPIRSNLNKRSYAFFAIIPFSQCLFVEKYAQNFLGSLKETTGGGLRNEVRGTETT